MTGKLILVGTPIGNLNDFSPRAVSALENCDFIAAEDTRVTVKLLNHFGIKKPMVSYFEHNRHERGEMICQRIINGETCVLVTDAGMPAISDPGEELVGQCAEMGIEVLVVPGPSAVVSALAVSGLPTGRFTFEGFLTVNKRNRKIHLNEIENETRTMIFYEAPHKLRSTLTDLFAALGERRIAIVREITKIHEEVIRTTLTQAIQRYENESPRGEIVLVIEGKAECTADEPADISQGVKMAQNLMSTGISLSDAAKQAAKALGLKKGDIYKAVTLEN